jgi:heat shock protein HslJ
MNAYPNPSSLAQPTRRCRHALPLTALYPFLCMLIVAGWLTAGGCAFAADLPHTAWLVKDVGGHEAIDNLRPTIEFTTNGQANGRTGCNEWSASSQIDGAKLSFGPVATTRMACSPPINKQESQFVAALAATRAFRIDANGLLVLVDKQNKTLMRASPR